MPQSTTNQDGKQQKEKNPNTPMDRKIKRLNEELEELGVTSFSEDVARMIHESLSKERND